MNKTVDRAAGNRAADILAPTPEDYLPAAIQKAVVQTSMSHPMTLYPMALGTSAAVVAALFHIPVLFGVAASLALIGPLWAVSQIFFRHDTIGSHYLETLHDRQKAYEVHLVGQIESGLKMCAGTKRLKETAITGIAQLKGIRVKLANVKELLGMKLRPNEITYGRFLGAAEQVSLSVLDNLNMVVSLLKSAASIDLDYVHCRLKQISAKSNAEAADDNQCHSLRARLDLWNSQLGKVERLMARNEEAMTEMERISAAVAQWQTGSKFAGSDLESAIEQLHTLALQAHEYDTV
jgi:hypothetical protein